MEKEKTTTETSKRPNGFLRFSGLGFQMVATLCLAAFGGKKLDEYFGLKIPVFLICLLLLGLGGSMYYFIKQVKDN